MPPLIAYDTEVTRVFPKNKTDLHYSGITKQFDFESDATEFMTYKINGKIKNITDYYLANVVLGFSAYNNKFDKIGVLTCIDTRQFLKKSSLNYTNNFSHIRVRIPSIPVNNTVGELMKLMRNDFNERVKRGEMFSALKAMKENYFKQSDTEKKDIGCVCDLSLIGTFDLGNKFKDAWVDYHINAEEIKNSVGFLSFSVIKNGVNTIYGKFRTATTYFSEKDAKIVGSLIIHGMKTIHPQMKISDALSMLKDYQNYLSNSLYLRL